jgi:hypothetical protein
MKGNNYNFESKIFVIACMITQREPNLYDKRQQELVFQLSSSSNVPRFTQNVF